MEINIIKSWRKSLSLRFDCDGILQVKAPKFTSQATINNFIQKNTDWIEKQREKILQQQVEKKLYLFGEELQPSIQLSPLGEKGQAAMKLEKFYKTQAKKYIPERCRELAKLYGFQYNKLRITSAMTRWGSCSSKKNLNFSFRLIMSPKDCIDYVIIHELCHLRQMNHGPKFWKEVCDIMPDYKKYEKHLRDEWWKYRI